MNDSFTSPDDMNDPFMTSRDVSRPRGHDFAGTLAFDEVNDSFMTLRAAGIGPPPRLCRGPDVAGGQTQGIEVETLIVGLHPALSYWIRSHSRVREPHGSW